MTATRTRQAILRHEREGISRKSCNECGQCSIACCRGSIFNAKFPLYDQRHFHSIFDGTSARSISRIKDGRYEILCSYGETTTKFIATHLIVATGPMETLELINGCDPDLLHGKLTILHSPMLRGLIFNPWGSWDQPGAVGQMVARVKLPNGNAYTSFVDGQSIPVSDWLSLLPTQNKIMASLISYIRRFFVAYLVFFSSDLSSSRLTTSDGRITIEGGTSNGFDKMANVAVKRLNRFFIKNRLLPLNFMTSKLPPATTFITVGPSKWDNTPTPIVR